MKRFLCLLAALCILPVSVPILSARAEGGFHETQWALPEGYIQATNPEALPQGGFLIAAMREAAQEWVFLFFEELTADPLVVPIQLDQDESIASLRVAADGRIAVMLQAMRTGRMDSPGVRIMGGSQTTWKFFDSDGVFITGLTLDAFTRDYAFFSDGRLAVQSFAADILLYDMQGDVLLNFESSDADSILAAGDALLIFRGSRLLELSVQDGSALRSVEGTFPVNLSMAASPDGTIWLLGGDGITRLYPGSMDMEWICGVTRYIIGAPNAAVSGVCALNGGTLIAAMGGGMSFSSLGGGVAFQGMAIGGAEVSSYAVYTYDAGLDMSSGHELLITALRGSTKLDQAVSDFQRARPDLTIRLETIIGMNDEETPLEDAVRTLNTRLLSGYGGDILVLDSLPLDRYMARGLLMPLDELAADLNLLPGILEGSRASDGHVYYLPAMFYTDTLWGNKEHMHDGISVLSLPDLPLDDVQDLLYPRTPEQLLELFYPACQNAFMGINGKPDYLSPAFKDFLDTMLALYNRQSYDPRDNPFERNAGIRGGGSRVYIGRAINMGEMQALVNGSALLTVTRLLNLMQLSTPYTFMGAEDSVFTPVPSLYGPGAAYTPVLMAGINAGTSLKSDCEAFLRMLFSMDVQLLETFEGMPVSRDAFHQMVDNMKSAVSETGGNRVRSMFAMDGGNNIEMKQPDDAHYDMLTAMAEVLNAPVMADELLMSFIVEETAAFFRGEVSTENTQYALYHRTMAYLNE